MLLSNFLSVVCQSLLLLLVAARPAVTCQTPDELQAAHRSSVNSQASRSADSIMETHQVVPNVIPTAPAALLKVTYPGGVQVDGGAELTPTQVKEVPQLEWQAEEGALYTVVMTDPDAPSRADPKFGEWRHWLVVNVPAADVSGGEAVSEYVGSGPPQGTGLHRYVFLVYKQPGKLTVDAALKKTKNQAKGREKWSVRQFAEQHGLGVPVAGNLYQAQWDDYVPQLYKQFTD